MKKDIEAHRRIGQWVKEKRVNAEITQTELSKKNRRHRSFIAKLEAGRRVDMGMLIIIAWTLGADLHGAVDTILNTLKRH